MAPEITIALIGVCIPVLGNIIIELIRHNSGPDKTAAPGIELPSNVSINRSHPADKTGNWFITGIIALMFGVIGYFIGAVLYGQSDTTPPTSTPLSEKQILEKVSFDYRDSPEMHGWEILDQPLFNYKYRADGFVGEY